MGGFEKNLNSPSVVQCTDEAGGVPKWYVGVVRYHHEQSTALKLTDLGYEVYAPVQERTSVYSSGRRVTRNVVVISCVVFVHATEEQRLRILKTNIIERFMMDRASNHTENGRIPVAVIPNAQMEAFRFMLFNSDAPVNFDSGVLHKGDRVRILRGSLKGLVGIVGKDAEGNSTVSVNVDLLGSASVAIDSNSLEII